MWFYLSFPHSAWERHLERSGVHRDTQSVFACVPTQERWNESKDVMERGSSQEMVVFGELETPEARGFIRAIRRRFLPNKILIACESDVKGDRMRLLAPYLRSMEKADGRPEVHICSEYACRQPVTRLEDLESQLDIL